MFTHICQAIIVFLLGLTSSAFAATYHVNQATGFDTNACSTNPANARQSINAGIVCLSQGDTLEVHAGTYEEFIVDSGGTPRPPSGTSDANPTIIRSAPGETVTIKAPLANCNAGNALIEFSAAGSRYIVIDGFILDGLFTETTNCQGPGITAWEFTDHIHFRNLEIKHFRTAVSSLGADFTYTNIHAHHIGIPECTFGGGQCSGYYLRGARQTVDRSLIHDMAGYCIQLTSGGGLPVQDMVVKNSTLFNCGSAGFSITSNHQIYNNLIYNSNGGIYMHGGNKVYNNTLYNITGGVGMLVNAASELKNNILLAITGTPIECVDTTCVSGMGVDRAANLCDTAGDACTSAGTAGATFVNAGAQNFALQAGASAVNAGVDLALVTTDMLGVPRPPGAYDLGALERTVGSGVATQLQFGTQPSSALVGQSIGTPTVNILDETGAPVSSTVAVTVALTPPPAGSLSGTTLRNAVAGTASFPGLSVAPAGANHRLTATSPGLTSALSSPFTITDPAVSGTIYYANAARPDNSATCEQAKTAATAKKTINAAIACMNPGETVIVEDGTYTEQIQGMPNGLSAAQPTLIRGRNKHGAIVTGSTPALLEVGDGKHITVENLVLDGNNWTVLVGVSGGDNTGNLQLTDMLLRNISDHGVQLGIEVGSGMTNTYTRVDMEWIGWQTTQTPGLVNNTTCGLNSGNFCFQEEPLLSQQLCHGFCHAYYLSGGGHVIDGGTYKHIDAQVVNPGLNFAGTTIKNSMVEDVNGVAILHGNSIVTNVTAKNIGCGVSMSSGPSVVHNTFVVGTLGTRHPANCGINHNAGSIGVVKNNLFIRDPAGAATAFDYIASVDTVTGHANIQGNVCDKTGPGCIAFAPSSVFVTNVGANNFTLPSNSVAIDQGVNDSSVASYTPDKAGTPRPVGAGRDAGAYEFTTSSGATALQFVAQPVATTVDTFLPPVTVQIVDSVGNRVTSSTASVTVASTPDGARLLGTKTRNAVAGLATFDDLSVTVVATGYTLQATSSGLTSATSAAFAITSPPPPPPTLGLAPPHTGGFFRR